MTSGPRTWNLDGPVFGFGWYARLTYRSPSERAG